jgi:hypothetical protein
VLILGLGTVFPEIIPVRAIISPLVSSAPAESPSSTDIITTLLSRDDAGQLIRVVLSSAGVLLVSAVFTGLFIRFFRRITASHLLFLYLFLFSLSGELLKAFSLILQYHGAYQSLILIISRISIGVYFVGLLSGFTISLYFLGVKYQHQGTAMVLILIIASFIAISLPLDTTGVDGNFMYQTAFFSEMIFVVGGILLLTLLGYISHLWESFSRRESLRVLFAMMFLVGHSVLHFSTLGIGSFIGGVMLAVGLSFYFIQLFYDYFWY